MGLGLIIFLLIKEKDFEKITVSDVIKKAGIVRSTFYNHYENIPALVTAAEDKTIDDIFHMMESFHPNNNDTDICRSYFLAICNYTKKNPFVTGLLQSPRGDGFFEKAITMFHEYVKKVTSNTTGAAISKETFSFMIAGSIGSTIGILHKWISEDFSMPPENVANILTRLFLKGAGPAILNHHQV